MKFLHFLIAVCCLFSCKTEQPESKQDQAIDQEIEELNHQLNVSRTKEMNLEIESQLLMFEEWSEYTSHLKEAEDDEHSIQKIEKRIQELEDQKRKLSQKSP